MSENQKKSLFREKSIASIESPEVLDHYLRVTSPGVWMLLGAVIVFLIGACVWGVMGHIDSKVQVAVVSDASGKYCLVPEEALAAVIEDREVIVDGQTLKLAPKSIEPLLIEESTDVYILQAGQLSVGSIVYPVELTSDLEEGIYKGQIITETITPISFILK